MKLKTLLLAVAGALWFGGATADAHHSLAATYDYNRQVVLEGKIVQLLLRNPHSFLQVDVPRENGAVERWSLEWRSVGSLGQQGVQRDTFKSGDEVIISASPSRTVNDTRGVLLTLHRISDGFGWGTRPGEVVD